MEKCKSPKCQDVDSANMGMPMQHEDGQAWAEAEASQAEPDQAAKQELQADLATCDMSESNDTEQFNGPTDIVDLDVARSIIQNCSLIVGIHPDQVRSW